jgi:hypothetical protein
MFLFTGHTASVTANALAVVNEKTKFHGCSYTGFTSTVLRGLHTGAEIYTLSLRPGLFYTRLGRLAATS